MAAEPNRSQDGRSAADRGPSPIAADDQPTRKRQARGQQRIQQILHASAAVFAEKGYDATTTNAIAAQAGISPGSLYQFFRNKEDIAHALAEYYAEQLAAVRAEAFAPERLAGAGLEATVDTVLGTLLEFNLAHPGFKSLFARADMPAPLRAAVQPIQAVIHQAVVDLVRDFLPDRSDQELERIATVAIQLVRGMTPLITDAEDPAARQALAAELRTAVLAYLQRQIDG